MVRVQAEDFDAAAEARALSAGRADVGAVVTFVGLCRDEGGKPRGAGDRALSRHGGGRDRARRRGGATRAGRCSASRVIHRFGAIRPGEQIVMVATASTHRGAAFAAAEMLMDYMKTRAPFWKRARRADGSDRRLGRGEGRRRRLRRPLDGALKRVRDTAL